MKITVNGLHPMDVQGYGSSVVYVSGSLGGGVATLGYGTDDGFVALTDGVLEVGKQLEVTHGLGMALLVQMAGSTGANLEVMVKGLK